MNNPQLAIQSSKTATPECSFKAGFSDYFYIGLANFRQQKDAVFNVRHSVYCEELGFEKQNADKIELDEYDVRASHYFVKRKDTGMVAGTIRTIRCYSALELLPVSQLFRGLITNESCDPQRFDYKTVCEISRLAVMPQYRHSSCNETPWRQASNEIPLALYFAAILYAAESGAEHLYITARPSLVRLLHRAGLPFICIGQAVELNGKRYPYYLPVKTAVENFTDKKSHFMRSL